MHKHLNRYFGLFALPTLIAFSVAFLIPFLLGIYLSFTEFTTVSDASFVGFSNYILAFTENSNFLNALWFTVKFSFVTIITVNLFAFLLALALTKKIRGRNLFRAVFFMPNLIGGIVLGYIWQVIINGILLFWGADITQNSTYGFWGLVVLTNWQMIGYMMVIYIAGINNIPPQLIEAAKIDGAKPSQILFKITLPLTMPAFTICSFLTLTNSFKLFDQNLALTAGAPARQTAMLSLDIYNTFYGRIGSEGVGQAKGVVFFLLVAGLAALQLYLTKSREVDG
ncbi:MAG: sugar ABC transporter permease [Clostridia bacterium]|nr:sugar ABC transporter permease [Clostridia bacterium]MBQ9919402.1 sugar ABC transporter permease [Clostridia bacterium]